MSSYSAFSGLPLPAAMLQVLGPFTFHYNTSSLNNGVAIGLTPKVGDVFCPLIVPTVSFNGTTPLGDVGTSSDTEGILASASGNDVAIDLSNANSLASVALAGFTSSAGPFLMIPLFVVATAATPLVVWASQTGFRTGTAVGGSAGTANVYIITATPGPL